MNSGVAESLIRQIGVVRQKSAKEVFGNSMSAQCLDLVYKLLSFSSKDRPSALEALRHPYLS